jgi:hypothetical protein
MDKDIFDNSIVEFKVHIPQGRRKKKLITLPSFGALQGHVKTILEKLLTI